MDFDLQQQCVERRDSVNVQLNVLRCTGACYLVLVSVHGGKNGDPVEFYNVGRMASCMTIGLASR
jgi:hypothetical protein